MRDVAVQQRRAAMLHDPHVARLTAFAAKLRVRGEVPNFDPLDGGEAARVLFLFEKPGPMTAASGFISRNNDDLTAEYTFKFMREIGIPREQTVIWNLVPWWNGTRKVTAKELRDGTDCVTDLITLLTSLRAVVMVGSKAARAKPFFEKTGLKLFTSCHPSPVARATNRALWDAIPSEWKKVIPYLDIGK
jgi:uracil-DNA glycosylase